jgi:Saxitoxin biosynthesis operon protein SxtJ
MKEILERKITKNESRDTGMAMVLLLLLLAVKTKHEWMLVAAIGLQLVAMTVPILFKPLAVVWFGFSDLLGIVVPKILLSLLFFGVVTPIAFFRRISGKDSLKLRAFRASEESAMVTRNHLFVAQDIEKPY